MKIMLKQERRKVSAM
jgi:NAD(P)-dependent dehydrogenase (short-subunit alcohol dehydrogenase family)